jgi:hypothetical protein
VVGYAALAIDGAGLFPMVGDERDELRRSLLRFASDRERASALVLIDRTAVELARSRQIDEGQQPALPGSDGELEGKEAADEGEDTDITLDGVTLSWDPDSLELKSA